MSEKLISAKALLEAGRNTSEFQQHLADEYDLECLIAGMPVVDAVEVVRCGKCRYWEPMNNGSWMNKNRTDGCCRVLMECRLAERYMTERDHFCGFGERREDNE